MAVDLAALKTELNTDPLTLGYAPHVATNDVKALADIVNLPRATIQIDPTTLPNGTVQAAIVGSEYIALNAAAQRAWTTIMTIENIPVKDPGIRSQILDIWAGGTTTRSNLGALQSRDASRAEELFGENAAVSFLQCADALHLS